MSCYACSKQYGWFTKEVGCPNCGFSFCTKCLKKEIEVPRSGNAIKKVCLSCHEKLFKAKELAKTAENESAGPSIIQQKGVSMLDAPIPNAENLPDIDEKIKNRLNSIKQPENADNLNTGTSDADIKERLANLKGIPNKDYNNFDLLNKKETRSEEEQTRDLIKQFLEEGGIGEAITIGADGKELEDPIKSIERRLAALKGESASGENQTEPKQNDDYLNPDKLAKRYLEEAKLPDFDLTPEEKEFVNSVKPTADTEELPWCTICNEDAVIRCIGCDGDLFCRSCFKEIHNDEEYREHQTKVYTKKADTNSNESN